jgi:hypothetical protein
MSHRRAVLDAVSDRLSTSTLRGLDGRVELARLPSRGVADGWLHAQALIPRRLAAR